VDDGDIEEDMADIQKAYEELEVIIKNYNIINYIKLLYFYIDNVIYVYICTN